MSGREEEKGEKRREKKVEERREEEMGRKVTCSC